jgi:hypothetical protein
MSWFRRRPKVKEPERKVPRHASPITERHLKDVKEKTKPEEQKASQKPE